MRCASFEFVAMNVKGGDLYIRDIGPWDQHPSVTNDAEGVVERLLASRRLQPGIRLFYYDSEGVLDELRHDGTRFIGFAPGPTA